MNACELALQAKECYARPNYFGRARIGVKVLTINRAAFILVMKVAGRACECLLQHFTTGGYKLHLAQCVREVRRVCRAMAVREVPQHSTPRSTPRSHSYLSRQDGDCRQRTDGADASRLRLGTGFPSGCDASPLGRIHPNGKKQIGRPRRQRRGWREGRPRECPTSLAFPWSITVNARRGETAGQSALKGFINRKNG